MKKEWTHLRVQKSTRKLVSSLKKESQSDDNFIEELCKKKKCNT